MSLLRTLDRTSAVSCPNPIRPIFAFLYPALHNSPPQRSFGKTAITRAPGARADDGAHAEKLFIRALARAGSCPEHAKQVPAITAHGRNRRKSASESVIRRQHTSARPARKGPFRIAKKFAEKELRALVDYYNIETRTSPESENAVDDEDEGSLVWNVGDEHQPWPPKVPKDTDTVEKLKALLDIDEPSHQDIWDAYRELSEPRVVYLPHTTIHDMLHHLAVVERPTLVAMQRYLSILDDMKNAHIHIRRHEWTSAIHLAGRYKGIVSSDELQSALYLWRDMEQRANIKGSHVTFNVLFDIAVKAGKFTLAEIFLKEMKVRRLKFHRHFRISLLYYHGVMQNGGGVRRVYQDMIEAGDIVDIVVMNAVIASLIRAGEPSAAEHVFERMKRLAATGRAHGNTFLLSGGSTISKSDRTWRGKRKLGLQLTYEAPNLAAGAGPEDLKSLQDWAPIAPDSRTYGLLIRHQATVTGNIDRINELLREMGYNGVPLEGSIFVAIFRGFTAFGGVRYSQWTRAKLEQTWTEYLQAVDDGLDRTWISTTSVVAALKAFRKCTDADRTLEAWRDVSGVWGPSEEEREGVLKVLRRLVPQQGSFDNSKDGPA